MRYKKIEHEMAKVDRNYMGSPEQKAIQRDFYNRALKKHGRPTNDKEWLEHRIAKKTRDRLNREVNPGVGTRMLRSSTLGIGAAVAAVGLFTWRLVSAPFTGQPVMRQQAPIQSMTVRPSPVMKAVATRSDKVKQTVIKKLNLPPAKKKVTQKKGRRVG
jgi:hypothetical protein